MEGATPHSGHRLVVMRHARAESFATDDHARRLTARGRRDAVEAGRWLAEHDAVPAVVLTSSAVRAVSTWQAVAVGLDGVEPTAPRVSIEDALFGAGPEDALETLRAVAPDVGCVLYVGHNPTVFSLVHLLDGGDAEPEAFEEMSAGYPPCAVTVFDVGVPWSDLAEGTARVTDFHVGDGS